MMQAIRGGVLYIFIVIAVITTSGYTMVDMHENAHYVVYERFGIESEKLVTPWYGHVKAQINLSDADEIRAYIEAKPYNIWVDIIGYHVGALVTIMVMCTVLLSLSIVFRRDLND